MTISNKLKIFIVLCIFLSTLVVPALESNWSRHGAEPGDIGQFGPNAGDIVIAGLYGVSLVLSGYILARHEAQRDRRGSISLLYHLVGAIVASCAALLCWILLAFFGWRYIAYVGGIAWASYGLHWLIVRNRPKGIKGSSAFK